MDNNTGDGMLPLGHLDSEVDATGDLPDLDGLFDALASTVRRQTLCYLLDEPHTTVETLATLFADRRSTADGPVSLSERDRVVIELRHVHLPQLADATLVEYDSATGDVRLREFPDPVRDLLRFTQRYERAIEDGSSDGVDASRL
ncbi:hypothetical protein IL252_02305 [Halomicrobium sp. IBSBa]|uniref:DUF7344 domain-containing protein n=1 Tax=Halomicrobium sp. IBSBa TaxID=2778916 RepID=UPI001ABF3511|nr:hypothetical protein [Halomicrobium sp. IBSBa]MBO4246647.1 hypothetical protein [Halomicrobium sp. IBSBa]